MMITTTTAHIDKSGVAGCNQADRPEGIALIAQRIGKIGAREHGAGVSGPKVPLLGQDAVAALKSACFHIGRWYPAEEVDRLRVTIRHQAEEIGKLHSKLVGANDTLIVTTTQLTKANERLRGRMDEIRKLDTRNRVQAGMIVDLQALRDGHREEIAELQKSIADIDRADVAMYDGLQQELDVAHARIRVVEAERDALATDQDGAMTAYAHEIADLRADRDSLLDQRSKLTIDLNTTTQERNNAISQMNVLRADVRTANGARDAARDARRSAEEREVGLLAELDEARALIDESAPAVRVVAELAALTDFEVQMTRPDDIRRFARSTLSGDFPFPRYYSEADFLRARDAVFARYYDPTKDPKQRVTATTGDMVETVATALGLVRSGQ